MPLRACPHLQYFARRLSANEPHGAVEFASETEVEFEERLLSKPATILFWHTSLSVMFHYMVGDYDKGIAAAEIALANHRGLRGHFHVPITHTFQAMCIVQLAMRLGDSAEDDAKRAELVASTGVCFVCC